jgi:transposase
MSRGFPDHKYIYDTSHNAYESFDFSYVGENMYKNRRAIKEPLKERNRRGRVIINRGTDKSLARPTSQCRRTESIVSLERGFCSCAELQVFSCYRGWKEACQGTRAISTTSRRKLSSIFFPLQGKAPKEIHAIMTETLGEHAPSYATVKNWVAQFKRGDFSTCDAPRPGRPKTVTTPQIIDHIHELMLEDRRISAKSIAEQPGISYERFMKIWTCGSSPWGGSWNAWTRMKNVNGASQ